VPRLTAPQRSALADWWNLARDAARDAYRSTDLIAAASDLAQQYGQSLTFSESTALSVLYGYARRMYNASDMVQNANPEDYITSAHIGIPPWARDEQVMNTSPIWHVTYVATFINQAGDTIEEFKTSVFEGVGQLPPTIGDLQDAIEEAGQILALKYGYEFVSAELTEILAV
jgi:hypothetical protein